MNTSSINLVLSKYTNGEGLQHEMSSQEINGKGPWKRKKSDVSEVPKFLGGPNFEGSFLEYKYEKQHFQEPTLQEQTYQNKKTQEEKFQEALQLKEKLDLVSNSSLLCALSSQVSANGVTENGNKKLYEEEDRDSRKTPVNLLHWKDMPRHLQFNPHVLTGYRPLMSSWNCVNSLFYFHNESVNIWTHGVSILYIVLVLPGLLPWSAGPGTRFLCWCHLMGALAPWCGSFIYHLFMNHVKGEALYHRLLQMDMLGIWVSQSLGDLLCMFSGTGDLLCMFSGTGALPMVTATMYCAPLALRWGAIATYCIVSLWGLYKAMRAWSPWQRRLCFVLPFLMRVVLAGARAAHLAGGHPATILHVVLQDAVSVGGGIIGALHIPEKWFPGTVDLYLNSHNIMHVMVVLAVYSMHQVTISDLSWMASVECHSPLRQL